MSLLVSCKRVYDESIEFFRESRIINTTPAECPLTRRLLPEFRALWEGIPAEIAPKLTVDFPCDVKDGFWAWGKVDVREQNACAGGGRWGPVERQGPIVPRFEVVARGKQKSNETSCGYVSRYDQGRPRVIILRKECPYGVMSSA
ncbi:hypothetical protein CTAM01_16994 [Colletotrichum tamarilloi]|uniref:Uncharacterized protein n=1 Tax=Colletotrichum tamarilloi TaxID=1209934 RepID=A0ABQ9QGX9_9PEZI|nr:uncharacterized protein CTAM01_16994 [Colletotrichum tamarilloi]KAK1467808.1 hypothetical protein CTAM01_16994 [Colletotrichum tamarilloi]